MDILVENNSITEVFPNVESVKYTKTMQPMGSTARAESGTDFLSQDKVWAHCAHYSLADKISGIHPERDIREVHYFYDKCPFRCEEDTYEYNYVTFVSKLHGVETLQCIVTTQAVQIVNDSGHTIVHLERGELALSQKTTEPTESTPEVYLDV